MREEPLRILALEPYYGGSHGSILDGLARHSRHRLTILSSPARKWKWRMRGAAIDFAQRAGDLRPEFNLVLANDMMSVADWRALAPKRLGDLPVVTYFHENQLTYPLPDEADRDYQYGFTNITTCLASDEVWFNSAYHRDEFISGVDGLLKRVPDCVPTGVVEDIASRSRVVHPGVEAPEESERVAGRPYTVLWNQRWEWDKNPEAFFGVLERIQAEGVKFRLAVAGETFREYPAVFDEAGKKFAGAIENWGYVESRADYERLLGRSDIVVSTARHEFFGLAVLEAVAAGCAPLLPRRLAYPEVFDADANPRAFYDEGTLDERLSEFLRSDSLPERARMRALAEGFFWRERVKEWDLLFEGAAKAFSRRE